MRVAIGGFGDASPFRRRAEDLGVADRVRFVDLPSRGEAMELLSRCRHLVLPSHHEGYGLVLLEAAQRSVPIVASAVDSIPELFRDCEGCRLVPPRDPETLASALAAAAAESAPSYEARRRAIHERFGELSAREAIRESLGTVIGRLAS